MECVIVVKRMCFFITVYEIITQDLDTDIDGTNFCMIEINTETMVVEMIAIVCLWDHCRCYYHQIRPNQCRHQYGRNISPNHLLNNELKL